MGEEKINHALENEQELSDNGPDRKENSGANSDFAENEAENISDSEEKSEGDAFKEESEMEEVPELSEIPDSIFDGEENQGEADGTPEEMLPCNNPDQLTVFENSENPENYQAADVSESENIIQTSKRKNKYLYPCTIITLVLVLAAVVIYALTSSMLKTSVKGVWISTEVEEATAANTYLVLTDNNVAYMSLGTMRYLGTYTTDYSDDGEKILTVNIPYALQASFTYEFEGKNIMALTMDGDTTAYTFKNVVLPDCSLTVPDDYVRDENLYGTWKDSTYDIEYTFRKDGTMLINEAGVVEADCIYNIVDGTIHVEYLAGEVLTMDMEYSVEGDNLYIGVMSFTRIADEKGNPVATEAPSTEETTAADATEETAAA